MQDKRNKTVQALGRLGYISRGVIYLVVGFLAASTVVSLGISNGQKTDPKGAIARMMELPYSNVLMIILMVGLIGYSVWRLIQAVLDADNHGSDAKALAIRAGLFVSAVTHSFLAYYVYQLIQRSQQSGGSSGKQQLIETVFNYPGGQIIVGLVGLIVIGFGISQFIKAYKEKYKDHMSFTHHAEILDNISKVGLVSRGVVFCITGGFVVYAAALYQSKQAGGLNKVWTFLEGLPFGEVLVLFLGIGLMLFAIYSGAEGIYRKVDMH